MSQKVTEKNEEQTLTVPSSKAVSWHNAYASFWKKYFVWKGRSARAEYWWPIGINTLLCLLLDGLSQAATVFIPLLMLFELASIFPTISVLIRRLHDVGHSAWLFFSQILLALFVAIVSAVNSGIKAFGEAMPVLSQVCSWLVILGGFAMIILSIAVLVFTLLPSQANTNKYDIVEK